MGFRVFLFIYRWRLAVAILASFPGKSLASSSPESRPTGAPSAFQSCDEQLKESFRRRSVEIALAAIADKLSAIEVESGRAALESQLQRQRHECLAAALPAGQALADTHTLSW